MKNLKLIAIVLLACVAMVACKKEEKKADDASAKQEQKAAEVEADDEEVEIDEDEEFEGADIFELIENLDAQVEAGIITEEEAIKILKENGVDEDFLK